MIKNAFLGILMLLILVSSAIAVDLREFPLMFTKNIKNDNVVIIIGKAAKAEDVLGSIDIVVMLQNEVGGKKLGIARLDSEIGSLSAYNSIIIGGPCANAAAAKLLNYPENCLEGFEVGKGYIKLYEWDNGNIAMLVAGTVALDTRRTTHVLANYNDYTLSGNSMVISGVSMNDLTIRKVN